MIQITLPFKNISFMDLLNSIKTQFPSWIITDMGKSSPDRKIFHYHISHSNPLIKGILELTFNQSYKKQILLKIADNRKTKWSYQALKELKHLHYFDKPKEE